MIFIAVALQRHRIAALGYGIHFVLQFLTVFNIFHLIIFKFFIAFAVYGVTHVLGNLGYRILVNLSVRSLDNITVRQNLIDNSCALVPRYFSLWCKHAF